MGIYEKFTPYPASWEQQGGMFPQPLEDPQPYAEALARQMRAMMNDPPGYLNIAQYRRQIGAPPLKCGYTLGDLEMAVMVGADISHVRGQVE